MNFFTLYDQTRPARIFSKIVVAVDKEVIANGPPCLQFLTSKGFPEGTRNNGLFNIGIFLL